MSSVGRYRLLRILGRGGMAEVFEAIAEGADGFQRRVAIKRLRSEFRNVPELTRMFLDEARICSHLYHGNIVGVVDYGIVDGQPFQVLEYVDGMDAAKLAVRDMPVEVALYVCTEIAHALAHAHTATNEAGECLQIVHRDVKPANVLVSWAGDVRLADFGIAFAAERSQTTSAGVAKGTPMYMAPEQVMGGTIDGRSDVFSLGCVLHALLVGRSPLAGGDAMVKLAAGTELSLEPGLPEDLRGIITRAVRRAKEERYRDAKAFGDELGAALSRRIDRDAKSLTRAWLATIRPDTPPTPVRGKLDALLDVDLVLTAEGTGVRTFATVAAKPRPDQLNRAPRRKSRTLWTIAGLAALAVTAGGWLAWSALHDGATAAGFDAAPSGSVNVVADAAPKPPPSVDAPPVPDAAGAGPIDAASSTPRRVAATKTGYLSVGGKRAVGAKIVIDGRPQGFAPKRVELSVGRHKLELFASDGSRLLKTRVKITVDDTLGTPARVMLND